MNNLTILGLIVKRKMQKKKKKESIKFKYPFNKI